MSSYQVCRYGGVFGFCLLLVLSSLSAQGISQGTITGTVLDQTGAVLPGVEVTITNVSTGRARMVLTNESGAYVAVALPVGSYEISAELPGFKRKVLQGIDLEAEQRLGVDIVLNLGEVSETVTVTATPILDKETGEVSSLVAQEQIAEIPVNGRNWAQFGLLGTGVAATSTDQRGIGQEGNPNLSVHGNRTDKIRYAIDGIQNMDTGGQRGINNYPPPEAIKEIKFLKSNFRAESGSYGAGVANVVTRAGGQDFHGTIYEFFRNDAMDAANFFADEAAPLKLNHFGFTIGGPFFIPGVYNTDKTKDFFFYSQSIYFRRGPAMNGATILARTPTLAMRQGDFTGQKTIKDTLTGEPFPGNIIPADRIDPNASIILDAFYPLPNRSGGQNFIAQPSQPTNWHQELVRWDHHFTENTQLMVRYIQDTWEQEQARALWSAMSFPTIGSRYEKPGKNLVANLTNVLSPT
ncbi:MAG: carboxypeptidase regulatory-like domain-containing protein, partial [Acidobacteriota bacterium]